MPIIIFWNMHTMDADPGLHFKMAWDSGLCMDVRESSAGWAWLSGFKIRSLQVAFACWNPVGCTCWEGNFAGRDA